jgi:hypothetical protein
MQKDEDSQSDPFLMVQLGDQKFGSDKLHIDDEPNPKFYQFFEIKANLPGPS